MGEIAVHLPSDLERSIEDLVSRGVYGSKEEAIIALIRMGISSLKKREEPKVYHVPGEHPPISPDKPPERWPEHFE